MTAQYICTQDFLSLVKKNHCNTSREKNENCHILANILQIWMIPHIHTLFYFISKPHGNQHQALNIKKIKRGQIKFREYWIALLQPMTVILSYKLRNVTYNRIANCNHSQAGDADSSRAPGLTSWFQGSVNVHRGALLLMSQWQHISSFVFYIELRALTVAHWASC